MNTAPTRSATIRSQTRKLAVWTTAWVVTMALASFGPTLLWDGQTVISAAAIALSTLVGIGMIVANKNHLMSLDELEQRIHLEAMGIALGVALVAGLSYSNLDIANVIPFDAEIGHLVILVGLTYLASVGFLKRKYA